MIEMDRIKSMSAKQSIRHVKERSRPVLQQKKRLTPEPIVHTVTEQSPNDVRFRNCNDIPKSVDLWFNDPIRIVRLMSQQPYFVFLRDGMQDVMRPQSATIM